MDNMEMNLEEMEDVTGGKNNGGFARKPGTKAGCKIYRIKSGDTLIKIANNHHTTADYLMRINPQLTNRNFIVAGCYIFVPA